MSTPESDSDSVKWDEVAKRLIEPQDRNKWVQFDVQSTARGHIESAILLWFLDADIAATYSLARAAQEVVHNSGKKKGKPGYFSARLESTPPTFRAEFDQPKNFFKHGPSRDYPEPVVKIDGEDLDAMLFDATASYVALYLHATPLMRLFATRATLERPALLEFWSSPSSFLYDVKIDGLKELCRSEFLLESVALIGEQALKSNLD